MTRTAATQREETCCASDMASPVIASEATFSSRGSRRIRQQRPAFRRRRCSTAAASSSSPLSSATALLLATAALVFLAVVPPSSTRLPVALAFLFPSNQLQPAPHRVVPGIGSGDGTARSSRQQQQQQQLQQRHKNTRHGAMMAPSSPTEVSDFELSVGRALDTLRSDYPYLLTAPPDFSLYDRDIEVVDPSGVRIHGLSSYRNSFRLLHTVIKLIYCTERSDMTFKMCYDKARQNIRCSWRARVVPREIFGGLRTTLHVDGISVYELDRGTGNITQHRIEQLLINNIPVEPKEGVIAALRDQQAVTAATFAKLAASGSGSSMGLLEFQRDYSFNNNILAALGGGSSNNRPSSLFAMEASGPDRTTSSSASSSPAPSSSSLSAKNADDSDFDWQALENKNKSRKKFGMKPLTPEEFLELETQVKQMTAEQQQERNAAAAASSAAEMNEQPPKENLFQKMFGNVLKDTCESNFDCERPEICCDFGFKKMCCASGTPVGANLEYAMVPVPVGIEDPDNFYRR